jgi:hypothetical protein
MKKVGFHWILVLGFLWAMVITTPAWAAYSSHQNDQDINNFLAVYPFARSTKLDDCSLCHPGGSITIGNKTTTYGSCDYCHIAYGLQAPHGQIPLNGYAQAYKDAGRSPDALRNIEGVDSDGDSYSNLTEIRAISFPGSNQDHPGLVAAPAVVMNFERILRLPDYGEFVLYNASKSTDFYATYRGVKMSDLLKHIRLLPGATRVTVFAPDGFSKTFPIDAADPQTNPAAIQYDVIGPYPHGYYYGGLDFVQYEYDPAYPYDNGYRIPDNLHMLLGYMREGDLLTKGKLIPDPQNSTRLVLDGEGPYRLIVPQKIAGSPDRPCLTPPLPAVGDGFDCDQNKDHNAGFSVRSVSAIRVEPLPSGTTDFNWIEGGWNLVDKGRLVIYGAISPRTYWIWGKVADGEGRPVSDVQISFGLISLGQVGGDISSSKGTFKKDLPEGEYIAIPSKPGFAFEPESIKFHLSQMGYRMEFTAYVP